MAASMLLALALVGPLPRSAFATPVPWVKLGYTGLLVGAAAWLAARAARPVARLEAPRRALLCVVLAMGLLAAAATVLLTAPGQRLDALMGQSWMVCPWTVLAFSLPALGLSLRALRGLAPTQPRQAGAAAGLLAGALGAFGYSLACPEAAPAFVAVWYTLGVLLTGLLGMALGSRLLRW
jgi:hypothetical protein